MRKCSKEAEEEPEYVCVLGWGVGWGGGTMKYKESSLNLGERLLLITKNRHLRLLILVLFYIWKMQEPGVVDILPRCVSI